MEYIWRAKYTLPTKDAPFSPAFYKARSPRHNVDYQFAKLVERVHTYADTILFLLEVHVISSSIRGVNFTGFLCECDQSFRVEQSDYR